MTSVQVAWPPALDYALAVVQGTSRTVGSSLAPGVQAWFASPEQGLSAAIESVRGAEETIDALTRLAPSTVTVLASVVSDRACWAEVTRGGDREPTETWIVGLTHDAAGTVSRLVWLRAPLAPPRDSAEHAPAPHGNESAPAPDARPILEGYLGDLANSRFREAAAHFALDTVYSHPPYAGGTERVLFRGREALRHGFVTDRGPSPVRQVITDLWQRGGRVFVEGVIEGIPDGGTFFSTAEINASGEIARYVAFYSATRIPRLQT